MSQFPQQQWGQPPQQPPAPAPYQPQQPYPQPPPQQWAHPQAPAQQQPYPAHAASPGNPTFGPPQPGLAAPGFAAPPPQIPIRGQAPAGLFSGVGPGNRKATRANYIRPGKYWCRIDMVKSDVARRTGAFFAVDMTVIRVLADTAGRSHRVGEGICYFRGQTSFYFLSDMQEFVAQVSGTPFEQVTEQMVMDVVGPRQPFNNTIVDVDATEIITKANKPFTVVKFLEIPPAEVLRTLDPQTVAQFFHGGLLERMAQADRRMGSPTVATQPAAQAPAPHAYGAPQGGPPAPAPPAGQYVQDPSQPSGWRWVSA